MTITQTLPLDAEDWLNTTIFTTENQMQLLLNNAASALTKPINQISNGIQTAINNVIVWAKQQTGNSNTWTPVVMPTLTIFPPSITGWAPALQPIDLSSIKIPNRQFSVEETMSPFVYKVFNVPLLIAYYLISVGTVLIAYSAVRIGIALVLPWFPRLSCTGLEKVAKCLTLTSLAIKKTWKKFKKPYIHIPFIIGLVMTVVVSVLLFTAIAEVSEEVKEPLANADQAILGVIWQINNFTLAIPVKVQGFVDGIEGEVQTAAYNILVPSINTMKSYLSNGFDNIASAINSALASLDGPGIIVIPDQISEQNGPLVGIPLNFMPPCPLLNLDALLLPESMAAVESTFDPWINDRIAEFYEVASALLIASIVLLLLPSVALMITFCKPFVPHSVNQFFLKPEYAPIEETPKKKKKKHSSSTKMDDFAISEPQLVEPQSIEQP